MKITELAKSITYYVTIDDPHFPEYRTDKGGSDWEILMGNRWEPVYNPDIEKELQKLFWDYKDQLDGKDEVFIR